MLQFEVLGAAQRGLTDDGEIQRWEQQVSVTAVGAPVQRKAGVPLRRLPVARRHLLVGSTWGPAEDPCLQSQHTWSQALAKVHETFRLCVL